MSNSLKILAEDKIQLTQDQKNLIELAFVKQVPPEDVEFMENVQKENGENSYSKLSEYFTNKYGVDFGTIYLSAIMGGKEKYEETVKLIEKARTEERIRNFKKN